MIHFIRLFSQSCKDILFYFVFALKNKLHIFSIIDISITCNYYIYNDNFYVIKFDKPKRAFPCVKNIYL